MQKISSITDTATSDGLFTNGSVATGVSPTILDATWFNTVQDELVNVVQGAGLALDSTNDAQLLAAIKSLFNTGRLIGVQIFKSSGTYTPTTGTNSVIVEAVGGGGGGGGTYTTATGYYSLGGGGGAGGYGKSRFTSGFSGVTVTIGAAGTVGAANSSTAGGSGGTTSFGSLLSCTGGTGGPFCSSWNSVIINSGAASGVATGANINMFGGVPACPGYYAGNGWLSGPGCSSPLGRGGAPKGSSSPGSAVGEAATGYGSGGSGGVSANGGAGATGGVGTAGLVIVWEYA